MICVCFDRITKRKDEVVKRRQNVKQLAAERRKALLQSQLLQDFKRDILEVNESRNDIILVQTSEQTIVLLKQRVVIGPNI